MKNTNQNIVDKTNLKSPLGDLGAILNEANSNSPFRAGLLSFFVKFFEMIILAFKLQIKEK